MKNIVSAEQLQAITKKGQALSPAISFELGAGDVVLFTGDNGAGKSTLLKTVLGLHTHYRGNLQLHCHREDLQYLPQLGNLHFHIPLTLQDMLPEGLSFKLLSGLDLSKKWNTASGGERQKVLLAAALAKKPRLLVLDEPFNHVDNQSAKVLEDALKDFLKSSPESALLIVSHRALNGGWPQLKNLEIR